jgi:hypothetical protein
MRTAIWLAPADGPRRRYHTRKCYLCPQTVLLPMSLIIQLISAGSPMLTVRNTLDVAGGPLSRVDELPNASGTGGLSPGAAATVDHAMALSMPADRIVGEVGRCA